MNKLLIIISSILLVSCSSVDSEKKQALRMKSLADKENESKKYFQQYNNTLTLDRAIQLSVERNLTLKTKTIEQEIAKLDRKIAFGNFLPKVSLGYSYTMLNDKIMGETKDTALPIPLPISLGLETRLVDKNLSLFSVNAQMPIFVPATWFLYSARQKGENISSLTRDLTEKMIKLQTIGQYHYILALESEKEYLKQELESAKEFNRSAKIALEAEAILPWEYEGTEQIVQMREFALKQNARDLQSAKMSLMNNLDMYPLLDFQLEKPQYNEDVKMPTLEETIYEALKNSELIQIREGAEDISKDVTKIAISNFLPKIVLTGGYFNTSNAALSDPDFFMGTLGGMFSIFNGFQNVYEYKKARKNQEIAFIKREEEIMKVIFETVNAYNNLESSKEERDIALKNFAVSTGRFNQKKLEKETDSIDNWEYIQGVAEYEKALSLKEKAEYKYRVSLATLNMLTGKDIFAKGEKKDEKTK
ncbi:MAG: TolC family protein [Fusobacterium sp.]|uniref:TolC family protein n=1 Tax=Fusobacterium sp. TaxID=68766 RepID=UPI0029432B2B|nr:TolC family protein [Fusobacterium sp.]MDY3058815.1 TolC family protein [Fusobacterium sp.]